LQNDNSKKKKTIRNIKHKLLKRDGDQSSTERKHYMPSFRIKSREGRSVASGTLSDDVEILDADLENELMKVKP